MAPGKIRGALSGLTEQLNQSLNIAMISSLRTGSRALDALTCMLVPLALRYFLATDYQRLLSLLQNLLQHLSWKKPYLHVIEYTDGGNMRVPINDAMNGALDSTDRNNLLQRAIRLFIGDHYQLKADELDTSLVPFKRVKAQEEKCPLFGSKRTFNGTYEQLLSFAVRAMPRSGLWVQVDERRGIWLMQTKDSFDPTGEGKNLHTKTTFYIKAYGPNASSTVAEWIDEAFEWYKEQRKAERDTSRYFFMALPNKKKEESKDGKAQYSFKQYQLSDHKTFSSLFFPERDNLLVLIDQFQRGQGKFAVEGFPNKLGLLLDGPPGTGKTSLIKALAHHTQRHVVSVNLTKVKTNQELMDLFFDRVFPVQGGEFPLKMGFDDLIFVMEDVDAASKVVYARKPAKTKPPRKGARAAGRAEDAVDHAAPTPKVNAGDAGAGEVALPPGPPPLSRFASASSDAKRPDAGEAAAEAPEEEAEEEEVESPRSRRGERQVGAVVGELLCQLAGGGLAGGSEGEGEAAAASSGARPGPYAATSRLFYEEEDELNLAGLLNVLDGVVDSPGRILVMTTNHPERLDPALIRPGRINKRIHLGYMEAESLAAMAEHYLQLELPREDRARLGALAERRLLTPAQVEQCCADCSSVDGLIARLANLS